LSPGLTPAGKITYLEQTVKFHRLPDIPDHSVISVNENENGEKRGNNKFVNEN